MEKEISHIVKLIGGLGNQMFQYAFAIALKRIYNNIKLDDSDYDITPCHNGFELSRLFNIGLPLCTAEEKSKHALKSDFILSRIIYRISLLSKKYYFEKASQYNATILDPQNKRFHRSVFFNGYWQSYKYFIPIEDEIRKIFTFKLPVSEKNLELISRNNSKTLIGIHVRRGDFLGEKSPFDVCNYEYYKTAIAMHLVDCQNPLLLFFSDDIAWCKENFKLNVDTVFVDWNKGLDNWMDMYLMNQCDKIVIANSSFSWWGAWLGKPKKVIAPSLLIRPPKKNNLDMLPEDWIKVKINLTNKS